MVTGRFIEQLAPEASSGLARALRALMVGTTHLVGLVEADGSIAYVSPSVRQLLGHDPDALVGSSVLSLLHPDDHGMALAMLEWSGAEHRAGLAWEDADVPGEYRLRHADGRWLPFEVRRNDFVGDPAIEGILVIASSVLARRALDTALTALAHDDDGVHALGKLGEYLDVRIPGTACAFALSDGEGTWVPGRMPEDLLEALDPAALVGGASGDPAFVDLQAPASSMDEISRRRALALGFVACWCFPVPVRRPRIYTAARRDDSEHQSLGYLVVFSRQSREPLPVQLGTIERVSGLADVVLRRRVSTRTLRHLVAHDQVTGVLSRQGFEGLSRERGDEAAAMMLIDLDDFKMVNDSHGHPVGDQVLRITAQRIQALLRPGDYLGRLGGDEFVLRVTRADIAEAASVAERILAALEAPVLVEGTVVPVRASIGIAPFEQARSDRELLARADAAMYAAKRSGKGQWRVWEG
jgi:diguanylate cyclase (GGDEF)-like protein/PAS domain S-box-containing protein